MCEATEAQEAALAFDAVDGRVPFDRLAHTEDGAHDERVEVVPDVAFPARHRHDVGPHVGAAVGLRDSEGWHPRGGPASWRGKLASLLPQNLIRGEPPSGTRNSNNCDAASLSLLSAATGVRRERAALSSGCKPTRQPLQPEATGAAMEATKWLEHESAWRASGNP